MIKFHCSNCDQKIALHDSSLGKRAKCPKCGNVCRVNPNPLQSLENTIKFFCFQCGERIEVSQQQIGRKYKCSKCCAIGKVPSTHVYEIQNEKVITSDSSVDNLGPEVIAGTGMSKLKDTRNKPDAPLRFYSQQTDPYIYLIMFLIILCPVLLIRGCIVANHPRLTEEEKKIKENWDSEWWSTVQARDAAKEAFEDTNDYYFKRAAKGLDKKQREQWRPEPKYIKNLGTPRTGEAAITYFLSLMCMVLAGVLFLKN